MLLRDYHAQQTRTGARAALITGQSPCTKLHSRSFTIDKAGDALNMHSDGSKYHYSELGADTTRNLRRGPRC